MHVRYLNLAVADDNKRKKILDAIDRVMCHGRIVIGPEVEELEQKVSRFCNMKYAVGVNSGTDALFLALRSLMIGKGDEVITTCLSWVATANAISMTGATPVFVDVTEDFNINPRMIEKAISPKTKAIVAVHFTGKICDMDAIMDIATKYNLFVVEDAAQAFGASYNGKKAGSFGIVNSFSMNPMKVFSACGEAGMVVTNDANIRELLLALRYNGAPDRMEAHYVSLNSRLDTFQAAILLERLKDLSGAIEKRRAAVEYYNCGLGDTVKTPAEKPNCYDVYYLYNIICQDRDNLKQYLEEKGIETKINHPILMPHQKAYKQPNRRSQWPIGEALTQTSLCLPLHENISLAEQDYVIEHIRNFYNKKIKI